MNKLKKLVLLVAFTSMFSIQPVSAEQTLYSRLGGYDALAAVVDDLMGRLAADHQVGRVLKYIPESRFLYVRQMMVDFLCAATEGPCKYIGKSMIEAHKGMGLTQSDWNLTVAHLKVTLNKFNVANKEQQDVINAISGLKESIIDI